MKAGLLLALSEAVAVFVADAPKVELAERLAVAVEVLAAVLDAEPVSEGVRAGVRVCVDDGVPVCVGERDDVALLLAVDEWDAVPVALDEPVPVALD